jgi:hypothetical protein
MAIQRYNAGIQRAKGLLEIAAGLYDSSLSYQTRRAAENVLQTDTDLGRVLKLSLDTKKSETRPEVTISFTTGSFREILAVAEGKYSLAWVNPSVLLTMAYRGTSPYPKRLPLRTVAVFPSYDVMGFAVHESTGITSLSQIGKDRIPLRLSTGVIPKSSLTGNATMFTVSAVLGAAGFPWAICVAGAPSFIVRHGPASRAGARESNQAQSTQSLTKASRAGVKPRWNMAFAFCQSMASC